MVKRGSNSMNLLDEIQGSGEISPAPVKQTETKARWSVFDTGADKFLVCKCASVETEPNRERFVLEVPVVGKTYTTPCNCVEGQHSLTVTKAFIDGTDSNEGTLMVLD
jgi:hypothetical protein